jgi:hypothetical protein
MISAWICLRQEAILMNTENNSLTYNIQLHTTENAINFVKTINSLDGYFDISMGSYLFDAKSILGVLSMDLRRVMTLHVIRDDNNIEELNLKLAPYCV